MTQLLLTRHSRRTRSAQLSRIPPILALALTIVAALATVSMAVSDSEIRRKLEAAYDSIDGLGGIQISVKTGAVKLTGRAISESARERAVALAEELEGVTVVDDEIEVERDVRTRLRPVIERLRKTLYDFVAYLPLIGVALVVLALFWVLSRILTRGDRLYTRVAGNALLGELLKRATSLAILLVGVLLALEILDATALVGAVLGTAGIAGLAIGFAFRDIMENYVAGVLLSLRQPFAPLDLIEIDGSLGKVLRLTPRSTVLMTVEGNHLRLPNAKVFKASILNYTRNPKRRFEFAVGVGMQENLSEVGELVCRTLREMNGILADPAPVARIEELGDFSVAMRFYAWVDQQEHDFGKVRSEAIRLVKRVLDAEQIEMPEPMQRVRIDSGDAGTENKESSAASEPSHALDVSTDVSVDRTIQDERARDTTDLLDQDATLE